MMKLLISICVLMTLFGGLVLFPSVGSAQVGGSPHGQIPDGDAFGPNGPFGQTIASVQALTLSGKDTIYAGSFGNGIFRSKIGRAHV